MSNPGAIDLDEHSAHESDVARSNEVDSDIDVAAQMGFSDFGGPPKPTYHYKHKGKKRNHGGSGGGGIATGANMGELPSGRRDGNINMTSSSSNVVMAEKTEIHPSPAEEGPNSLSQSHRVNQNQIPGLPTKPEFSGVPRLAVVGPGEEYSWDNQRLGHGQGQGQGQGDSRHHRDGHGGRGRGRWRGGRGSERGNDVGNAIEGYFLPSFIEDPWAQLRTSMAAPYEG